MRASLKGVLSRVDRLADHMRRSPEDRAANFETMSDEELYARVVELVEKAGGIVAFSADGMES